MPGFFLYKTLKDLLKAIQEIHVAISESDIKLLWGRSAGRCSNPTCRKELTLELEKTGSVNIGEMAHVIARQANGPRGDGKGGNNSYSNLILLCPGCHTQIDKAPADYPEQTLHDWKKTWEAEVRSLGRAETYSDFAGLKKAVARLLIENKQIWTDFGPESFAAKADPGSNLSSLWSIKKLDTILPNNTRIVNMIENNAKLLSSDQHELFARFKSHAAAFEKNQYHRLDSYPLFPKEFEREFRS